MIRICVKKEDNGWIKEVIFEGHALFDKYGKDIVCAAVSATMLCTVNAIYTLNDDGIKYVQKQDKVVIQVLKFDNVILKLLDNMIRCLLNLEKQYPKNIKIDEGGI